MRVVRQFALRLLPFFGGKVNAKVRFAVRDQKLRLSALTHTGKETPVNDASKVFYYSQAAWAPSLRAGQPTGVLANCGLRPSDDVIPLYSVDAFKGLERDALVLFVNSVNRNLLREMYVGSSRAVCYLHVVVNRSILSRLTSLDDLDRCILSK